MNDTGGNVRRNIELGLVVLTFVWLIVAIVVAVSKPSTSVPDRRPICGYNLISRRALPYQAVITSRIPVHCDVPKP